MITKKEIKEYLKDYMLEGEKIIDIDLDKEHLEWPIWVLVKNPSGCIYHYTIRNYELGYEYIEIERGLIFRTDIKTRRIKG